MRFTRVGLLIAVVGVAVPQSARAIQVDISYTIKPEFLSNKTALLGRGLPTGGTATVRWNLTGTGTTGNFATTGNGSVISLLLTNDPIVSPFRTTGAPHPQSYFAPGPYFGRAIIRPAQPIATYPARVSGIIHKMDGSVFPVGAGETLSITIRTGTGLDTNVLQIGGAEVSRTVVPEPSTSFLLALGLCGLAAGRTVWRRRERRSA